MFSIGVGFFFSLLMSALALALGHRVRQVIAATGHGRPGQARAALVVGAVGFALAVVAGIVWVILQANGFTPQDLQHELEQRLQQRR